MIPITPDIEIEERELQFHFIRASGPGGQNVNKVATAVELRFDVLASPSLPSPVRLRLLRIAGSRVNREGVLVISASRYRTQEANRKDAIERLSALIIQATRIPRPRRATKPSAAARHERLNSKRKRGTLKKFRGRVSDEY